MVKQMWIIALLLSATTSPDASAQRRITQGVASPQFSAKDVNGKAFNSVTLKGRAHLLFFFCGCDRSFLPHAYVPQLQHIFPSYYTITLHK